MMQTNTPAKRKLIDEQRKSLLREFELKRQNQSVYEDFDEDKSRHEHDLALQESIVEHYELMPLKKSRKKLETTKNIKLPEVSVVPKVPEVSISQTFSCY